MHARLPGRSPRSDAPTIETSRERRARLGPGARLRPRVPRAGAYLLRALYALLIVYATLRGLEPQLDRQLVALRLLRALHPPLRPADVVDGIRNVALFGGFGAVWLVTEAPSRLRVALLRSTIAGALLSVTLEAAQLLSPTRMASVLDLAMNTAGAFLGALAIALAVALARARRAVRLAPPPLTLVGLAYTAACLCEALSPFGRLDRVPGAGGGAAARWRAAAAYLRDHGGAVGSWTDALLFAPVGALVVLLCVEWTGRVRRSAAAAVVGGALAWGAVEVMRGMTGGDLAPWEVVIRTLVTVSTALATAGALRRAGPERAREWVTRSGLTVLAAVVLLWSWRPLVPITSMAEIAQHLGPTAFIPMAALSENFTLHSALDVAVGFLLYLPIGAWLSARDLGADRAAGVRALLLGIALPFLSEAGQVVIATRTVDITDVLVQAAGVFVGWAVVRQAAVLRRRD